MELRNPSTRHAVFLALLALLGACLLTTPARAAQPGVVSDLTWYIPDSEKERTVAAMQDIGSDWTRLAIQWREAEPEQGKYNEWWLDEYEKAIEMADAAGQKVIVMVDSAPAWASGSPASNAPRNPEDFARFIATLAERYAGRVDAWEVWNEPNLTRFWSTGPDPAAYAALLRAAYPAVKAADPDAKVIFAGTSGNDYDFLAGAYAAGAKGHFDVLATHPYPYCGSTGPADIRMNGSRISKDSFLGYREMHATMLANGDAKPIWITEMGWTTSGVACNPGAGMWQGGTSEAHQADYLYEAFKLLESDPYVEVALWYNIRNNYWMHDEDSAEARYGLMRTDFSPKPAYGAFKAYALGLPYTPSTKPPPTPKVKVQTSTTLQLSAAPRQRARAVAEGRVKRARRGTVTVYVQTRRGKRWRTIRRTRAKVDRKGRYSTKLGRLPKSPIRARAVFRGSQESKPSRSRFVRVGSSGDVRSRRR